MALAVGALGFGTDAGAKCAMQVLDDEVVTHAGDTIPASGGVLVAWTTTHDGQYATEDPVVHRGWKFREKKKLVRAQMTMLAPGLAVYWPKLPRNKKHTVTLTGDKGKKLGTYTIAKQVRKSAGLAPDVTSVTRTESQGYRGTDIEITAHLGTALSADAYGLILYDATGTALSWRRVDDATATDLVVYASPGHCGVEPPGMSPAAVGDQVTFAWVNRYGQLSATSAAIAVTK
jgi:hypothetical protein